MYLCSAFGNFLGKVDLPYLALPFNLIAVCSFLTLKPTLDSDLTEARISDFNISAALPEFKIILDSNDTDASNETVVVQDGGAVFFASSSDVDWMMVRRECFFKEIRIKTGFC